MFEDDPWLPSKTSPRKHESFAVPRMPTVPITRTAFVYGPGQQYSLLPNFFPYTSPTQTSSQPARPESIQIVHPLDIGYRHRSQVCLVEVVDGRTLAQGTRAVLRAYDPLYIRPDDLHTISLPSTFPSASCPDPIEISTSVDLSNGSLQSLDPASMATLSIEDLQVRIDKLPQVKLMFSNRRLPKRNNSPSMPLIMHLYYHLSCKLMNRNMLTSLESIPRCDQIVGTCHLLNSPNQCSKKKCAHTKRSVPYKAILYQLCTVTITS